MGRVYRWLWNWLFYCGPVEMNCYLCGRREVCVSSIEPVCEECYPHWRDAAAHAGS